jgi:sugar O-acyltransferase (sialic acid O-acetyltransferase NeuD family)
MLIYGASGHGSVVLSILESLNYSVNGFFDDNSNLIEFENYKLFGKYSSTIYPESPILITIGDNLTRFNLAKLITHPFFYGCFSKYAIIDNNVSIGCGTVIFQSTVIQKGTKIGMNCIINTNASVDHHCIIEDFVHIAPSSTLCGNVKVGEGSHVGAGSTIIQNIRIGKWCVIGAGAVITKDIPDYSLVVGVPGKIIKSLRNE